MNTFQKPEKTEIVRRTVPLYWRWLCYAFMAFTAALAVYDIQLTAALSSTTGCGIRCPEITDPKPISDTFNMIRDFRQGYETLAPAEGEDAGAAATAAVPDTFLYKETENIVVNSADLLELIKKVRMSSDVDSIVLVPAAYNTAAAASYRRAYGEDVHLKTTVMFGIVTYPTVDAAMTTTPSIQLYDVGASICPPPGSCGNVR